MRLSDLENMDRVVLLIEDPNRFQFLFVLLSSDIRMFRCALRLQSVDCCLGVRLKEYGR